MRKIKRGLLLAALVVGLLLTGCDSDKKPGTETDTSDTATATVSDIESNTDATESAGEVGGETEEEPASETQVETESEIETEPEPETETETETESEIETEPEPETETESESESETETETEHTHEYGAWTVVDQPTCTEGGLQERTCVCGEKETGTLAALGHTAVTDAAVAATCHRTGLTEGSHCSVCHTILTAQQETPRTEHVRTTIPAIPATCFSEGVTEGVQCGICGDVLVASQPIEKLPHTEVVLPAVAPSCAQEGLTGGKKCSVCGTVTVAQETIAKLPHTEEFIPGTEPTCSETGLSGGTRCSVCKEVLVAQTILPKTACHYESVKTAPTCEERGYTTHTCSVCGDSYTDRYVDPLGHVWGAWEESGGYTIRECVNDCDCGTYQRIASISATYNGDRLVTGESVQKDDVEVTALLTDGTTMTIRDYTFENNVMQNEGKNIVTIKFCSVTTDILVSAIYDNLPGATSSVEFSYDAADALKKDAVTITGFVGVSVDIVIPSYITIEGTRVPVRKIADYAFQNAENIRSVVIPDSVTSIGTGAFHDCQRMTTLTLGKGLSTIACGTFYNCLSLTEVNIPANVTALQGTTSRTDKVQYKGVFENCTSLKKVTVGDANTGLAQTTIGYYAFYNCSSLEEVYIGNLVTSVQNHAFENCGSMKTLTLGTAVQTIGAYAFADCSSLVSLTIPDSVTSIGTGAFHDCQRMTTLTLGKGLSTIACGTFYNCLSLTEVNIPANVTALQGTTNRYNEVQYKGVFENCTALKKVTIGDANTGLAQTTIGYYAFYNCTALEEVYIGNLVTSVQNHAFDKCGSMKTLTLGTAVQTIGEYAFGNCGSLVAVVIPDSVTSIGIGAFHDCKRMTTLTLGKGLSTIACGTFYNCLSLTEVNIPANVTALQGTTNRYNEVQYKGVFENCTALKKVTIGDANTGLAQTTIGYYAFYNCTALEELYIGNLIKAIEDYAFAKCTILETVNISDSVQTIGSHTFEGCVMLENFNIGTGVQSIGAYALAGCTDLTSVTIPGNVRTFGNNLFNNCTALEDVVIESERDRLRSFGKDIFNGCTSFDRIYYTGTAADWAQITINSDNEHPLNVTPYYYSESKPTTGDNYWYYNGQGEKRVWNVPETSFEAEYYAENFLDLFGDAGASYATSFYNEMKNDSTFQTGLLAWEALHIIADTSFSEGVWQVSKKDLYKLVIFDLLCGEANSQETIVDIFDTSAISYVDDLANDIFGSDVTHDFLKSISPSLDYSTKLLDRGITGLQFIFESSSNMYDALKTCATYLVLADMEESFQTVLLQIANDSSNPRDLRDAAREYAEIFNMSTQQILDNFSKEYWTSDFRAAFTVFTDVLWDKTLEFVFPELAIAQTVAKGVLFLADLGCNIDDIYKAYYKLDVAVHLEASLRKVIYNTQPDYFRVTNRVKSQVYVYAVDMYKTSVLLGYDYSNNLLKEECEKKSEEEKQDFVDMMNTISSLKADKQKLYNRFSNRASQAYTAYYA